MIKIVKIAIGAAVVVLTGAGIYLGLKDGKAKEAEINEQYEKAIDAINQMKQDTKNKMKEVEANV